MGKTEPKKLTPQEELFCQYYAKSGEAFGNGTRAYALAFDKDLDDEKEYEVCKTLASRLLSKVHIYHRKEEILAETLDERIVDKELAKVILQDSKIKEKVAAIGEYNKVRGRHTEKHKHEFEGVSSEALADRLARILAGDSGNN